MTSRHERYKEKRRNLLAEIKSQPCADCGGIFPPCAMDFDHRDPTTKEGTPARLIFDGLQRFYEEIAKCDLVCANCHRVRTHGCREEA